MKYAVEMGSDALIYIPKIGSGIKKLMGGGGFTDTQIHRQHGDRISLSFYSRR
jgi:hypothetical protein